MPQRDGTESVSDASARGGDTPLPAQADAQLRNEMTAIAGDTALELALSERDRLIQLCMYALDRARSTGVAQRLSDGLLGIGVTTLRPDGRRFDPAHHEAGGTLPTEDPALDGLIAETELPGFADRDRVLRAPVVTVYRLRTQTGQAR